MGALSLGCLVQSLPSERGGEDPSLCSSHPTQSSQRALILERKHICHFVIWRGEMFPSWLLLIVTQTTVALHH